MIIKQATIEDLPKIELCATDFYSSSQFLKAFDLTRFCELWTGLIENNVGVIFAFEDLDGNWAGMLGGMAYLEIYSGRMTATEMFWFVREGFRGPGLKLYKAFEKWARDKECSEIRMVHLLDSMPQKLERVYTHFGYKPAEIHYSKDL